mgnify:CR=1 FL=1|jgi:hypothetical protein
MVKITNIGNKYRILRTRKGNILRWSKGDTVEVEDKNLLRQFESSKHFKVEDGINAKDVGGGIKTHIKTPKRRGRPPKSKKHLGKSKQTSKEKVKATIQEKVDKVLKKPKGLMKKSRKKK